jgi:hypothetical protein
MHLDAIAIRIDWRINGAEEHSQRHLIIAATPGGEGSSAANRIEHGYPELA